VILAALNPAAIFFDLDGTLADSIPAMRLAYQRFVERLDVVPSEEEFVALNGPPLIEIVQQLKLTHNLGEDTEALVVRYRNEVDRAYANVPLTSGARELIETAKLRRCKLGIVTSNSAVRTKEWLAVVGICDLIDFVVAGDHVEVGQGKPSPEPYLAAIQEASCSVVDIIAVEDSLQGVQSAVAAGLTTFHLSNSDDQTELPRGAISIQSLPHLMRLLAW